MRLTDKFLILFLICAFFTSLGQHRCGTDLNTINIANKSQEYAKARANVNLETSNWINENYKQNKNIINIPVVVHVVFFY